VTLTRATLEGVVLPYSKFVLLGGQLQRSSAPDADPSTLHRQAAAELALAVNARLAPRFAARVSDADRLSIVTGYTDGCSMRETSRLVGRSFERFAEYSGRGNTAAIGEAKTEGKSSFGGGVIRRALL
jgi:hypothetical protein